MPNAITVLWRTCVKFTKLQNLIFFFFFFLVSPTTCFLWNIFFLPCRHSFISDPFRCLSYPLPIFCSVFLFLQLLCSNRSNDDRLQWKQRFDSLSRGVQCSHHGGRAGMTHWCSCVLGRTVDKKLEPTRKGAVLATVQDTSAAFRDVTPWCSVSVVHCFETTYYLHLQGLMVDPPTFETGGIMFFRNVGETLPECHIFTSHKKLILRFFVVSLSSWTQLMG
jgi:hypothetical protein